MIYDSFCSKKMVFISITGLEPGVLLIWWGILTWEKNYLIGFDFWAGYSSKKFLFFFSLHNVSLMYGKSLKDRFGGYLQWREIKWNFRIVPKCSSSYLWCLLTLIRQSILGSFGMRILVDLPKNPFGYMPMIRSFSV